MVIDNPLKKREICDRDGCKEGLVQGIEKGNKQIIKNMLKEIFRYRDYFWNN